MPSSIEINGAPAPHGTLAIHIGNNGKLFLFLPGQNSSGHYIQLTPDERGMKALVHILRHRESTDESFHRIGSGMADPTQVMVEEFLAAHPPAKPEAPTKPEPSFSLQPSEIDELLSELELRS